MSGAGVVAGILLLGAGTTAMKVAGPVLSRRARRLPAGLVAAGTILPTGLLSALVAVDLAGPPLDAARLGGAAVAGLAVVLRVPFLGVVLGGTATAAMIRLLGG